MVLNKKKLKDYQIYKKGSVGMITNSYSLTINGYDCKLNKPLKFYQGDSLHLIFTVNQYEWVVSNGNQVRAIMPINPLKAFLIIENPEDSTHDTVESVFVENDEIHFHIDSKYTSFIGVGRMQLVLADDGCCNVTIPEFTYEVRKNITDKLLQLSNTVLVDSDNKVLITDSGDSLTAGLTLAVDSSTGKYIKDLPNKEVIIGDERIILQDTEGTKQSDFNSIYNFIISYFGENIDTSIKSIIGTSASELNGLKNELNVTIGNSVSEVESLKDGVNQLKSDVINDLLTIKIKMNEIITQATNDLIAIEYLKRDYENKLLELNGGVD